MDGTRPRNMSAKASITGCGITYYINNVNGSLYLSTSANSASGTFIVSSKAPNKDCIINLAFWGAGGKGGEEGTDTGRSKRDHLLADRIQHRKSEWTYGK